MYSKLGDKLESKGGAVVKALPLTHQCGSGLNFEGKPICELSLLLVPFLAPLIFFAVHLDFCLSHKPMFPKSTTIRTVDEESLHVWMCFAYFFLSFLIL